MSLINMSNSEINLIIKDHFSAGVLWTEVTRFEYFLYIVDLYYPVIDLTDWCVKLLDRLGIKY